MLETLATSIEVSLAKITFLSYLVVLFAGVLTSFTPCVYPVIPVTAAYIGANSCGSKMRGFFLSLFYVLGIAFTYSCLGAIAALSGTFFGQISASPWTNLIVGNILLFLGLYMLDVFTIPLPVFLASCPGSGRKNVIGAFLVGATSGLVMGPCTAPVLGSVLTYVASKQNVFQGITLLFVYALGLGFLPLLVGTFAGLSASLPRSGKWMNIIKKFFGIILILCAEYFIITAGKRF